MESFETKAFSISPNSPNLWLRYVDDTFVVQKTSHKCEFLKHINSIHPYIKFTLEETRPDESILFLDTLVMPQSDGILATTIYKKPTHTDQYLQLNNHYNISAKYSVTSTLIHKGKIICSN